MTVKDIPLEDRTAPPGMFRVIGYDSETGEYWLEKDVTRRSVAFRVAAYLVDLDWGAYVFDSNGREIPSP